MSDDYAAVAVPQYQSDSKNHRKKAKRTIS